MAGGNVEMMVSVVPGTMTGFASLNAGLASINNAFLNMTQAISDNFGLVDTAMITTGVVIAQVAADAANAFGDFEQAMKIVQLVSGQTADEISMLGQKANEFAVQYRVDIDQVTEGLQTLGRAGLNSATEQTEVLQNGLSTAKLEGRQLNDVLQELIQNTSLLGGDLKTDQFGEQSQYLNDLLVATSMTAPITTHDVSETLKYSGGIAAAAGANIESDEGKRLLEDYMATIAAFAQKGVTGSIAGTALRAFLNKPATQDSSVLEGLATIKLKPEYLWEDDQETMKPISEQIALIQGQMDKLNIPKMDRLQIWSKIVGGKMGQQMMKLESGDIKSLVKDIQNAESAESLANKSMQTFNMNVNELSQKGAAAFRDFGSKIVFFLNPVLTFLNKITDFLSNPIGSSAFFIGFLAFMNQVLQKIRNVFGAFRQGVSNIWRDYLSGDRLSIRDYRGGAPFGGGGYVDRSVLTTKEATTPKTFLDAWKNEPMLKMWQDYQKGILTKDQFGTISATQSWRGNNKWLAENYKIEIRDSDLIKQLSYKGLLSDQQMKQIQDGTTKTSFMKMHDEDIGEKYYRNFIQNSQEAAQATQNNAEAQKNHATASESAASAQQQSDATKNQQEAAADAENLKQNQETNAQKNRIETQAGEQIVTNTRNTASTVIAEWNNMCASMSTSLEKAVARNALINKYGKGSSNNIFEKLVNNESLPTTSSLTTDQINQAMGRYGGSLGMYTRPSSGINQWEHNMNEITNQVFEEEKKALEQRTIAVKNEKNRTPYVGGSTVTPATASVMAAQEKEKQAIAEQEKIAKQEELAIEKEIKLLDEERIAIEREILAIEQEKVAKGATGAGAAAYDKKNVNAGEQLQNRINKTNVGGGFKDTGVTASEIESAMNRYGSQYGYPVKTAEITTAKQLDSQKVMGEEIVKQNQDLLNRTIQQKPMGNNVMPAVSSVSGIAYKMENATTGAIASIKGYLGKSREGRMIDFLGGNPKQFSGLSKSARTAANGLLNLTDVIGGPVMVAMMAIPMIIQQIQNWYQSYTQELKEAKTRLEEAYTALETAEDNLRESFTNMYPDLDETGINELVYDTYSQMTDVMMDAFNNGFNEWKKKVLPDTEKLPEYEYDEEKDDGSMKEKEDERTEEEKNTEAVNENTRAVYAAVAEINTAMDQLISKSSDEWWGIDGRFSEVSDEPLGSWSFLKYLPNGVGSIVGMYNSAPGTNSYDQTNWIDNGGAFLMTNSQKDENYQGYTELPGLLLEDWKDASGDWIAGLRVAMGNNVDSFRNVLPQSTSKFMSELALNSSRMGAANNLRLQQSMKQDKKTWQGLAKEIAKQEKKTGKSVGKDRTNNKRLEGLLNKINTTTGNNFSRTQLLQAAYLQQMQDMLAVAQQAIVPIIAHNAETAAQNLLTNQHTAGGQDSTSSSTYATYEVASVIAAMVAQIAIAKSAEATYNQALANGPGDAGSDQEKLYNLAQDSKDANDFYKKAAEASYGYSDPLTALGKGIFGGRGFGIASYTDENSGVYAGYDTKHNRFGVDHTVADAIAKVYGATSKMSGYGYDTDSASNFAEKAVKEMRGKGFTLGQMLEDFGKNYTKNPEFIGKIENAYLASDMGEDTGDSSGGGGGDGGGGGGDSGDSNKGNKKERVDLVLCNKKEIPKLNVNLFKKAPSFTVLNKNFKLRDIKVNTQDKPKAVLSSIKNAIIDVQKRSDPKIIQDESAEYDPASATDGSPVPSGSTNTATD